MPVHLDARPAAPSHARALTPRRGPVPLAPLLVLQRTAGNRAVASLLARGATGAQLLQRCTGACCTGLAEDQHDGEVSIQRDSPGAPAKTAGVALKTPEKRTKWTVSEWGSAAAGVFSDNLKGQPMRAIVLIHAQGVAFYTGSGKPIRQLVKEVGRKQGGFYRALYDGTGWSWYDMQFGMEPVSQPLGPSGDQVVSAIGRGAVAGESIVVAVIPTTVLVPDPEKPQERTPTGQKWADGAAAEVSARWKDPAPAGRRSALPGPPKVTTRFSEQTGWHLRISLAGVETEVAVTPGEKQSAVDAKVRKAVTALRAKYDPAAVPLPPGKSAPPPGGRHDPKAPPPPDWWVPFEVHPSQQGGEAIANAPALPARVEMKDHPEEAAPDMVAGSSYDFQMKVQWTNDLGGLASAMGYGYYWEILAASPADWHAIAGIPDPAAPTPAAPVPAPGGAVPAAPAPAKPGKDSAVNQKAGSGRKVGRYEGATRDTQYTKADASQDVASTWEDDRIAVVGESVAGGFKVAKTWVVDVLVGVTKKDDIRSMQLKEPGYYIIRCTAWNTSATAKSQYVRASSVDARPVKVVDANRVAVAGAREQLEQAAGVGAFERYQKEVADWERRLRGAQLLAARRADPTKAVERLSEDELDTLARKPPSGTEPATKLLTDGELQVLTELEIGGTTLADYAALAKAQLDQLTAKGHAKQVSEWWANLKDGPTGARDVALGASFVKERSGERVDLKLMLGEAKDSTDARPHWMLYDITSPQTRDEYSGAPESGGEGGAAAHLASIRHALVAFAGGTPYGRGTFGMAWPQSIGSISTATLPLLLKSEPDKDQRRKSRHQAYVDIATLIVPAAKVAKLAKLAAVLEAVAAIGGGLQALDALRKRVRTGHLYDVGTLLEIVQVVGAVRAGGAAAAGVLRTTKVIQEAKEVKEGISLLAKLDTGVQMMVISHSVLTCLEEAKAGSPNRQVLQGTYCIAKGIHDGTVAIHAVTAPKYGRDEPAAPGHEPEPHGPGVKKTKDGRQQVEVEGGAIEVCPIQRCPRLRETVGDRIRDPDVADRVRKAEKEAIAGHAAEAATEATAALDRAATPRTTKSAATATKPISKRAQKLLDQVDTAAASLPSPVAKELLDDLRAKVRDPRAKMTAAEVDAELLRVPALAEVIAQRRAWQKDPGKAQALAVLDDLELGLRSGKMKRSEAFGFLDRLRREAGGPGTGSPSGSARERLTARHPDIGARFAQADAAFAKRKKKGANDVAPSVRFDAAMAVLEKAGLGDDGRAAIEALFRPRGRDDLVSKSRFEEGMQVVTRVASIIAERPDLATATGQAKYRASVEQLGHDVAAAYRKGVTLEGRPIANKDAPELVEAMARMDKAFADQRTVTDPIERFMDLARLRDEVARAGEVLRSYDPRFAPTQAEGARRGSKQFAGATEKPITITASGTVGEPLARDLPGIGLERYVLLPDEIGSLQTVPRGLARAVARVLAGFHRAHLIGPGFGGELSEGLMLAPKSVNLGAQNRGVEAFIRSKAGEQPTVTVKASGRRIELPLKGGGTEHVDILTKVDYVIKLNNGTTYRVIIEIGAPPGSAVEVHSTIPLDEPGGTVLRPAKGKKGTTSP